MSVLNMKKAFAAVINSVHKWPCDTAEAMNCVSAPEMRAAGLECLYDSGRGYYFARRLANDKLCHSIVKSQWAEEYAKANGVMMGSICIIGDNIDGEYVDFKDKEYLVGGIGIVKCIYVNQFGYICAVVQPLKSEDDSIIDIRLLKCAPTEIDVLANIIKETDEDLMGSAQDKYRKMASALLDNKLLSIKVGSNIDTKA